MTSTMEKLSLCCSTCICHKVKRAVEIAVETVPEWLKKNPGMIERVIFNVFKDEDKKYYEELI